MMNQTPYIQRTYRKFDNVLERYAAHIFSPICDLTEVLGYQTDEHLRLPPTVTDMRPIHPGDAWGHEYGNIWLHCEVTVPEGCDGQILCAIPDAEAVEILCYRDGKPSGIINSKNNFLGGMHSAMFITDHAAAGEHFTLDFECYAGHDCLGGAPYSCYGMDRAQEDFTKHFHGIRLCVLDKTFRDFCFDLATVLQIARLPENNFTAMRAHECLMDAFPHLIQDTAYASVEELRAAAEAIRPILAPALEKHPGGDRSRGWIGLVGHSHMDTAWLWPVSETIRKCARTYAEALTLMDMYPDYTFIQSSALHLSWMKDYYPAIFEGIREKVAEGRYDPNGGVWVECDCNVTGGESMVRQFLYGQRFTEQNLGYRSDTFWLPDTFGYNGAIPQIMFGAGVKYFYTTKMSWSDRNTFPADTFVWRGIDGSEVLTHLNQMNVIPDVSTLNTAVNEIRDKHSSDSRLVAYGFGDGGGGPTYGVLEYMKRVKDLDGMPTIEPVTVSSFMQKLEARRDKLPLYDGELYLEYHRGTLTQMHDMKKNNRLAEIALRNMELFGVLTNHTDKAARDEMYRVLLKNQFHDILPGTSLPKVYEIAIPELQALIARANEITADAASSLATADENQLSLYNTLSFDRHDYTTLDGAHAFVDAVSQVYTDMDGNEKTVVETAIPAMGTVTLTHGAHAGDCTSAFTADGNKLTTPLYTVTFDESGYMASLIDRRVTREVKKSGGASLGTLWFGECLCTDYDNWEIEDDIFKKLFPVTSLLSHEVVTDGAVEYRVRNTYRLSKHSTAVVDTVFYARNPRIDFEVKLDWHETHALLKAGFDVNVRSGFVKNEIQFGHVERPTTRNTSLEAAKFEVCNHRWSDLSESRYGVAVLNDCKYGISVEESDMRLTLQKGCYRPDPITDNGVHTMTYSLLPHMGAFAAENVVYPAYELNNKPVVVPGVLANEPLFTIDAPNVICETVKAAEELEDAYVLRLYECERNTTNCTIALPMARRVTATNLLEEEGTELPVVDGKVAVTFHPFEIKTLVVERSARNEK